MRSAALHKATRFATRLFFILCIVNLTIKGETTSDSQVNDNIDEQDAEDHSPQIPQSPVELLHYLIQTVSDEIGSQNLTSPLFPPNSNYTSKCRHSCIHGECSSCGYCACFGDWYGDRCEVNPTLSASYFPTWREDDVVLRSLQASERSRESERLIQKIDSLQHLHSCADPASPGDLGDVQSEACCSIQVVVMAGRGLGSWVHHISGALTWSITNNKTLVLRFPYDYFFHDGRVPLPPPPSPTHVSSQA
jgi:hypothetical protein